MKPDGIEQEIWDAANEADRECQRDSCKNNACNGFLCANAIRSATLQARSQAYAECAKIADDAAFWAGEEASIQRVSDRKMASSAQKYALEKVAQAIRQHSQKGEDNEH